MGLPVNALDDTTLRSMRDAGVSRVEWDHDGTVSVLVFTQVHDTEPAPSMASTMLPPPLPESGVHLKADPDEVPSDALARELGWCG